MRAAPILALLPAVTLLGCPGDDATAHGSTSGASSSTSSTGAPDPSTTSTTDASTSTGMASSTTSTGTGTSSSGTESSGGTESSSGTDTTGTDSGTTGEMVLPCAAGCVVEFMCSDEWNLEQDCVDACTTNLMMANTFSEFCRMAWEELHACIGTLTCMEYEEYLAPMVFPYPCWQEAEALGFECRGQ